MKLIEESTLAHLLRRNSILFALERFDVEHWESYMDAYRDCQDYIKKSDEELIKFYKDA